jgi:hypothetical protein
LGRKRSLPEFFSFPIRSYWSIASLSRLADHWSTALLLYSGHSKDGAFEQVFSGTPAHLNKSAKFFMNPWPIAVDSCLEL